MKLNHRSMLLLATIGIAASPALAGEIGDPAPPLNVAAWIKGDPVVLAEGKGKNVYVIHFWKTTSAPCLTTIPHLTSMQNKYKDKDVIFVGISFEQLETVKTFVETMGSRMGYRVAVDNAEATATDYLVGFRVDSIPHAFLVDQTGVIVWHGHPVGRLDRTIAAVLAGTYSLEESRRIAKVDRLMHRYFQMVKFPGKADKAGELGQQVVAGGRHDAALMNEFAWKIVTEPGLIKRDLQLALRAAQTAYDACEGKEAEIVDTYARVLFECGRKKDAVEYQKKALELAGSEEMRKRFEKTLKKYMRAASGE